MKDNSWFYMFLEALDKEMGVSLDDLLQLWQEKEELEEEDDAATDDTAAVQYLVENDERMWGEEEPQPTEAEKAEFKKVLEELAVKENPVAMRIMAYHYYGGSPLYPCNWKRSRTLLLRTFALTKEPLLANTLGYIYYYGRCNDGVPEYDQAFRYFSYAAAHGIVEAQYKLADMYAAGKGIWQSKGAAVQIIERLYSQLLPDFCRGEGWKFADVALRMGKLYEDGFGFLEPVLGEAYIYYLQADYAIKRRRQAADLYGDKSVQDHIEEALQRVRNADIVGRQDESFFQNVIDVLLQQVPALIITAKKKKSAWKLTIRPARYDADVKAKLLLTLPQAAYCGLVPKITVKVSSEKKCHFPKKMQVTAIGQIAGKLALYDVEKAVCVLPKGSYVVNIPGQHQKKEKKYRIAQVTFTRDGQRYDYLCGPWKVKKGDWVYVDGAGAGRKLPVVNVFTCRKSELKLPLQQYCKVVQIV